MTSPPRARRTKEQFLRTHESEHWICKSCGRVKPVGDFWDSRNQKPMKVCRPCLKVMRAQRSRRTAPHPAVPRKRRRRRAQPKPSPNQWRQRYLDYIQSDAWVAKKAEYWAKGEFKVCYVCGRGRHPGMQLHHRTYERFTHEDLNDLVPVCKRCHEEITRYYKTHKRKISVWDATEHVRGRSHEERLGQRAQAEAALLGTTTTLEDFVMLVFPPTEVG